MKPYPKQNSDITLNQIRFESDIPFGARLLYAEMQNWSNKEGRCPFEAKLLAKMYKVSEFTIRKWVKSLVQHDHISLEINMDSGNQVKMVKFGES